MKNFLTIIAVLVLIVCNVQANAGVRSSGVIENIDLVNGLVQINGINYQIQKDKTRLISGEHKLRLKSLKIGSRVSFSVEDSLVTEIKLKTPYVFKY